MVNLSNFVGGGAGGCMCGVDNWIEGMCQDLAICGQKKVTKLLIDAKQRQYYFRYFVFDSFVHSLCRFEMTIIN